LVKGNCRIGKGLFKPILAAIRDIAKQAKSGKQKFNIDKFPVAKRST